MRQFYQVKSFLRVLGFAACLLAVQSAPAAIYQWEYDSFSYPGGVYISSYKILSGKLCVDGATANVEPNANLANRNLRRAYLEQGNLDNAVFVNSDLAEAIFIAASLRNANFTNANLENADFSEISSNWSALNQVVVFGVVGENETTDFDVTDFPIFLPYYLEPWLKRADLTNANFTAAKLGNANFSYAELSGANFTSATLGMATFYNATLSNVDFSRATINGAEFSTNAAMHNMNFTASKIGTAYFSSLLYDANFTAAQLEHAEFSLGRLYGANFTAASLGSSDFSSMIIKRANFTAANLGSANFSSSWLVNADFTAANAGVSVAAPNFSKAIIQNARFAGANLKGANFTGADLRGSTDVNLTGAITTNMIYADGTVNGLNIAAGDSFIIRNHVGDAARGIAPVGIKVQNGLTLSSSADASGELALVLSGTKAWNSTISFVKNAVVNLNGKLALGFEAGTITDDLIGKTYKLFDWTGASRTGSFGIAGDYLWDTSKLYSTGEVSLLSRCLGLGATRWTGAKSGRWNDAANWSTGTPSDNSMIVFDSESVAHEPVSQNISTELSLTGIAFTGAAGEHTLSGAKIKLKNTTWPGLVINGHDYFPYYPDDFADSPASTGASTTSNVIIDDPNLPVISIEIHDTADVTSLSANDQYIGNDLELAYKTQFTVGGKGVLTLGGELSGAGQLTKKGTGTLVFENTAAHTGGTVVEAGVLALDATGQIHGTVKNQATLEILAGSHTVEGITGSGTTVVEGDSVIVVGTLVQDTLILGGDGSAAAASPSAVPEPATLLTLVLLGVCAALVARKKR